MNNSFQQSRLYLSDLGIACALGRGKESVAHSLFKGSPSRQSERTLLSGKTIKVIDLPFEIDPRSIPQKAFSSRNNALLQLALEEIEPTVRQAIKRYGAHRVGVVLATSTSGMKEGETAFSQKSQQGTWPEVYTYSQQEVASPSLFTSHFFNLQGLSYTISTACSAGSKALCSAQRLLQADLCDAVIVGGVDTLCNMTLNGFDALGLLSKDLCNPFSKNRNGLTLGEGAAVFLMEKDTNNSLKDNAVEFLSSGETSDAYHMSSPDPSTTQAQRAIHEALSKANLTPQDIRYINLHGTATPMNDLVESHCISNVFDTTVSCSSTKALSGHTLGASGALEAGFLWLCLTYENQDPENKSSIPLPPHIWDHQADPEIAAIRFTSFQERIEPHQGKYHLLSTSFAFGGSNVALILSKLAETQPKTKRD